MTVIMFVVAIFRRRSRNVHLYLVKREVFLIWLKLEIWFYQPQLAGLHKSWQLN